MREFYQFDTKSLCVETNNKVEFSPKAKAELASILDEMLSLQAKYAKIVYDETGIEPNKAILPRVILG